MKNAPRPLWVFAMVSLFTVLVIVVLEISTHPARTLATVAIALLFTALVLGGSRVIWSLLVVLEAFALFNLPFTAQPWWAIALLIVNLACLLAPTSLRFIWGRSSKDRDTPRPTATSWNPTDHLDADRPSGWYIDASSPRRMRYWNEEAAEWQGTTRTPRKLRRASAAGDGA